MNQSITIPNVDLGLLEVQRKALQATLNQSHHHQLNPTTVGLLQGLESMLDHWSDQQACPPKKAPKRFKTTITIETDTLAEVASEIKKLLYLIETNNIDDHERMDGSYQVGDTIYLEHIDHEDQ